MRQGASPRNALESLRAETQALKEKSTSSAHQQQPWSPELVRYLSTSILVFGLGVMVIMGWLVVRRGITQGVLRLICVPLIVVAAVFLMVVGYDDDQLTPIIGLLGTIAGYLLGRTDSPTPARPQTTKAPANVEPEPPAGTEVESAPAPIS